MNELIGGSHIKPFVKGSSKPKEETTLNSRVAEMITLDLIFKEESKTVDIKKISHKNIYKTKKGKFRVPSEEVFNYSFEGQAEVFDGVNSSIRTITGYFNTEDEKTIDMYNVIQIS